MSIDISFLERSYFWFDEPVPYEISKDSKIYIYPVGVKDSEKFLSWVDLITIDKNSLSPDFISLSYLRFLCSALLFSLEEKASMTARSKLASILNLCLGWETNIQIFENDKKRIVIKHEDIEITEKQFEDIRRIILYQNLLSFDDAYINPDVKQAINEVDEIRSRSLDIPNLERRISIITSHTGISKSEQLKMSYRSHTSLFNEVCGEVDYVTIRSALVIGNMFSKNPIQIDDWIYRKKQNKYDKYFVSQSEYSQSMGGQKGVRQV